jgi:hypothetical protein
MRQSMKFVIALVLSVPLHIGHILRDHMQKTFGAALLLACGLAITDSPARALQIVVTQVDKNIDGSMTYYFAVRTDPGETLTPGQSKVTTDFVTVYNFYGLIDGEGDRGTICWERKTLAAGANLQRFETASEQTAKQRDQLFQGCRVASLNSAGRDGRSVCGMRRHKFPISCRTSSR